MTGNHRTLHLRQVVAEPDRVDQFAGPFVSFWIEGVDVADPATHEQKDDRPDARREMRRQPGLRHSVVLGPKRAEGSPDKTRAGLEEKLAPGDSSAGIDLMFVHRHFGEAVVTAHTKIHPYSRAARRSL